jgi:DNA helicase-2/ATP-dependent DNA helicase PcrA
MKKTAVPTRSAVPSSIIDLTAGDHVTHERFGQGEVRFVDGEFPNTTAVIEFDTAGTKKLLLRFARLTKV